MPPSTTTFYTVFEKPVGSLVTWQPFYLSLKVEFHVSTVLTPTVILLLKDQDCFLLLENIARDAALPEPTSAHHNCQKPNPG